MKNIITFFFLIAFSMTLYGQMNIKWEEEFNGTTPPPGWVGIDHDGSGNGLQLFQSITLQSGTTILPQAGMSFWSSNYQNANLAGLIDEWLITPQISVIYAGDSLYFWAGAIGGAFDDSLRVWVSTTDNQLFSFTHLIGYFRVDGPAGSWHKYGFDLSPFDSSDIYLAVNYYIRDGGSGGQYSDFVWIDHFIVTGDPGTINTPPTSFSLLEPPNGTLLHPIADTTIHFSWSASTDGDGDTLRYSLKILDAFPPIVFNDISDTTFALNWQSLLFHWSAYRWTMSVTDGKSTVATPDTFFFVTPPIENLAPFAFSLLSPPDGDTLSVTDSIRFLWRPALDPNSDTLTYGLHLTGNNLDTTFGNIADTFFVLTDSILLQPGETYQWSVEAADSQFTTPSADSWSFITEGVSGLAVPGKQIPEHFVLEQNYPNPFNPSTNIGFRIPRLRRDRSDGGFVSLAIYDVNGREIKTLISKQLATGSYTVQWNGRNGAGQAVASGVYLYRLQAGGFVQTKKLILLK